MRGLSLGTRTVPHSVPSRTTRYLVRLSLVQPSHGALGSLDQCHFDGCPIASASLLESLHNVANDGRTTVFSAMGETLVPGYGTISTKREIRVPGRIPLEGDLVGVVSGHFGRRRCTGHVIRIPESDWFQSGTIVVLVPVPDDNRHSIQWFSQSNGVLGTNAEAVRGSVGQSTNLKPGSTVVLVPQKLTVSVGVTVQPGTFSQ